MLSNVQSSVHVVMLFLDGVYVDSAGSSTRFRWVKAPSNSELNQLSHTIAHRLARYLERQGLLERDAEHSVLALDHSDEDPMDQLRGHSIAYRIAVGPERGRKVFTLQTLPGIEESFAKGTGQAAGFSLHAGVAAKARQREKLERLCRYVIPAIRRNAPSKHQRGQAGLIRRHRQVLADNRCTIAGWGTSEVVAQLPFA